jgi:hypothetical protein
MLIVSADATALTISIKIDSFYGGCGHFGCLRGCSSGTMKGIDVML